MGNRWWLLTALAAVVLTLSALLLLSRSQRPATSASTVTSPGATRPGGEHPALPSLVPDAGGCPDAELPPPAALPEADTATLLLFGDEGVRFQVDGEWTFSTATEPRRFRAGKRRVHAEAAGHDVSELVLTVEPFKPGLVLGLVEGAAVVLVPLDVTCAECGLADAPPDLAYDAAKTVERPLPMAARSLATGNWRAAATTLAGVPPAARDAHFDRLVFALQAQAGLQSKARAWLEAQKGDAAKVWAVRKAALEALGPAEQAEEARVAVARWNVLTDRFAKLADAFGTEAPGPVQAASARFNELSQGFMAAAKKSDVLEEEGLTQAGAEVLTTLVRELRRLKPADCAWQARITTTR